MVEGDYDAGLGWLLRAWRREVAERSLRRVAGHLGVSHGALSQWETRKRRNSRPLPLRYLAALDDCYGAGGSLVDLAAALGTPEGLPPRRTWAHNFQGESQPVWAWLRPAGKAGYIDALALWGAFRLICSERVDERGFFITSPVSMPNPAVWIHLREPAWVDFGRGKVPRSLGIPMVDALSGAELADGGHTPLGLVGPEMVARYNQVPDWAAAVGRFFGTRSDLVDQVIRAVRSRSPAVDLTDRVPQPATAGYEGFDGPQWRSLRVARGMSRTDAAHQASELMPGAPVTVDQVAALEAGHSPRPPFLRSRLDYCFRADGHTGIERVEAQTIADGSFEVHIPDFWIGPVWFTMTSSNRDETGHAVVRWGPQYKMMRVFSRTTVTCRRPTREVIPFSVQCPDSWKVTAGMGVHPDARDINWGWLRDEPGDTSPPPMNELFIRFLGRTPAEFEELWAAGTDPQ